MAKSYVEDYMHDALKDHVLHLHTDTDTLKAYYMRKPSGGRSMSVYLIFSPEGIVITGDLCLKGHGIVGARKSRDWFASDLSEGYLCEKFLEKVYVPEYAAKCILDYLVTYREELDLEKDKKKAEEIVEFTEILRMDPSELSEQAAHDFCYNVLEADEVYSYTYDEGEAGWLCAIQQRFRELYLSSIEESIGNHSVLAHPAGR